MLAMVLAVRHDAVSISPHSGGELSLGVTGLSILTAVVLGIRAAKKRRWLCAAMMALTLVCCFACDHWLTLHTPPCAECEPVEFAEWIKRTGES